ncbi:cytochrome c biogenesis protein [Anaeromyxobacter soli]|uniref:cytochrome c biogenesis protein n=1 Tax=Anaeromyxobacter soli TaxID=2922725 RepID=UPI001FAF3DE4|nr:cytochrome c biogenesis protein CcsA [Anaeromyxobacter sp. SG29]
MNLKRAVPWIAFGLALAGAASSLLPSGKPRGFDVEAFGQIPVLEGGRVKPVDTIARNALLMIRGKQSASSEGRSIGPDEWLLDVMFRPEVADRQELFVIDDPEVLGLLGIQQSRNRYYSFATLAPRIDEIQRQYVAAEPIDPKVRSHFQSAIVNLFERMFLYHRLKNTVQLEGTPGLAAEIAARAGPGAPQRHQLLVELAHFKPLLPVTPAGDAWRSVGEALTGTTTVEPGLEQWARLGLAYQAQDAASFNRSVADLAATAALGRPDAAARSDHEWLFNAAQPFYSGMVIYVLALLAVFVSWLWRPVLLQRLAFGLLLAGAVVHTLGLASRVLIQGRPPVTNLYSSAVFVGWAAVLLGVVLERMYRRGFATAVAASSGFASLIVAHHLSVDGDTMEMMRAVLDSNFWLATHVVTITIGYSGTFLAGALAIGWVVRRHLTRRADPAASKAIVAMTYGIICFALFFSFVGTVLGGIWADQSWGRFWGWDPKENGALLIVLWNAIILHARWAGYARERGIMAMAIFGNVITSFSWFGVNMLGVGLHSYGFMDKAFWALSAFVGTQLVLMLFALVPARFWSARRAEAAAPGKDRPEGASQPV